MKILRTTGTIVVLCVSWFLIHWYLSWSEDVTSIELWNALIAAGVVGFGFWLVHTGRLARLFRRV